MRPSTRSLARARSGRGYRRSGSTNSPRPERAPVRVRVEGHGEPTAILWRYQGADRVRAHAQSRTSPAARLWHGALARDLSRPGLETPTRPGALRGIHRARRPLLRYRRPCGRPYRAFPGARRAGGGAGATASADGAAAPMVWPRSPRDPGRGRRRRSAGPRGAADRPAQPDGGEPLGGLGAAGWRQPRLWLGALARGTAGGGHHPRRADRRARNSRLYQDRRGGLRGRGPAGTIPGPSRVVGRVRHGGPRRGYCRARPAPDPRVLCLQPLRRRELAPSPIRAGARPPR